MYAVRPALRLSFKERPPARFIRGRRYPLPYRVQPFHSTRSLAQTPNSPPTPGNTPVAENEADKRTREGEKEAAGEQPDASVATEDPEVLAQKLQRSKEMTRRYSSALKRMQRRGRAQDLPPIYIPDWFLEKRVRLREDDLPQWRQLQRKALTLSIKHDETGDHGACLIPLSSYATAVKSVSRMTNALWNKQLSEEQRRLLAQDLARRLGLEDDAELVEALKLGGESRASATLEEGPDGSKVPTEVQEIAQDSIMEEIENRLQKEDSNINIGKRISPVLLAEIRATMAASLSATHPASSDPFPSAKTNLILHSPSSAHESLLSNTVHSLAWEWGADVVTLTAQDLAQLGGDYLGEGPEPSPHSIRSLGYETYKIGSDIATEIEELGKEEPYEDAQDSTGEDPLRFPSVLFGFKNISQALKGSQNTLFAGAGASAAQSARALSQQEQLEDLKLTTLLEALVDSSDMKRDRGLSVSENIPRQRSPPTSPPETTEKPKLFDFSFHRKDPDVDLTSILPTNAVGPGGFTCTVTSRPPIQKPQTLQKSRIIYIKDIKELNATQYGSRILQKLEDIIRKQRTAGESIMLLGTTCSEDLTPEMSPGGVQSLQSEGEYTFFRTIVVPSGGFENVDWVDITATAKENVLEKTLSRGEKNKFHYINIRHIQDMLRCLDPEASANLGMELSRSFGPLFPSSYRLTVLKYDQVHRIALTALGLHLLEPSNTTLSWAHVSLAMGLLRASDETKYAYMKAKAAKQKYLGKLRSADAFREEVDRLRALMGQDSTQGGSKLREQPRRPSSPRSTQRQLDLNRVKAAANSHERKLMHGIVDSEQMRTTFDQVHVPKETIEGIRTITSLSLLRPDAFNYGVLATEKISGALLYGPPGTGKTLLAKAVAKESGSIMLEVSGSQIADKYVGEGEKNVAAIFSLARKLSPCIVFLDEADAIFGTRDAARERTSHRDILNQFLKEWDGLNDHQVFVMVATNRPFDLDDAVIRRLPRRLLVDLPTQEDRKKIMEIHLRGEQLDASVDLDDLAKRTPFYSGSDLKNVAVFAALACVREENEQAAIAAAKAATGSATSQSTSSSEAEPQPQSPPTLVQGLKYEFPERRILHVRHFDKALQEVSASISENMSSLNAIKRFDEQYGDRKGRKKKTYGFGTAVEQQNENAARVRG